MTVKIMVEAPGSFQPVVLLRPTGKRSWTMLRVGRRHGSLMAALKEGDHLMGEEGARVERGRTGDRRCADCGKIWTVIPKIVRCPFCDGYLRKSRAKRGSPSTSGRSI